MDRRNFFRKAFKDSSDVVVKHVAKKVKQSAARWVRPPYAINELEFLLGCTRCGDCIEACPHDVVFGLSAKNGAKAVGTPALDLINKGCHLCDDWPCVTACEPKVLYRPSTDTDTPPLPKFANITINESICLPYNGPECGACFDSCPVSGALLTNSHKPSINEALCVGCSLCRSACITEPKAIQITSLYSH